MLVVGIVFVTTGCVSLSENTELADGSKTSSRGLSFWSKTGLESAASSKKLSSDNYERSTALDGLETEANTQELMIALATLASARSPGTSGFTPDQMIQMIDAMNRNKSQLTSEEVARIVREQLPQARADPNE